MAEDGIVRGTPRIGFMGLKKIADDIGPFRTGKFARCIVADHPTGFDDEGTLAGYGGHLVCESIGSEGLESLILASPDMLKALLAARQALKSYQYGNASTELAEEIGGMCDEALRKALAGFLGGMELKE